MGCANGMGCANQVVATGWRSPLDSSVICPNQVVAAALLARHACVHESTNLVIEEHEDGDKVALGRALQDLDRQRAVVVLRGQVLDHQLDLLHDVGLVGDRARVLLLRNCLGPVRRVTPAPG